MRNVLFTIAFALVGLTCQSQDLNPQHYSGKYYITMAGELFANWYSSYDEHSTFRRTSPLAATKIRPCVVDFEKGVLSLNDDTYLIKVTAIDADEYYTMIMDAEDIKAYQILICSDVLNSPEDSPIKMEFRYDSLRETAELYLLHGLYGDELVIIEEYFLVKEIK